MVYQIWLNTCYRGVAGQVATAHEVASRGGRAARGCGYGALLLLALGICTVDVLDLSQVRN